MEIEPKEFVLGVRLFNVDRTTGIYSQIPEFFSVTHWGSFRLINKEEIQTVYAENNPGLILHSREVHIEHYYVLSADLDLAAIYIVCAQFIKIFSYH